MWNCRTEQAAGVRGVRYEIDADESPVTCADVLRLWQSDERFRDWFNALLAESTFSAFRWETPPITKRTAVQPFEFVLIDSPSLARQPDPAAFAKQFRDADEGEGAIAFSNLGKDATMVVPCPRGPQSAYTHLAAFVREAPEWQRHALWKLVGATMESDLTTSPLWLSTAGAGVAWLHVRLDQRPKYYGYAPYRAIR